MAWGGLFLASEPGLADARTGLEVWQWRRSATPLRTGPGRRVRPGLWLCSAAAQGHETHEAARPPQRRRRPARWQPAQAPDAPRAATTAPFKLPLRLKAGAAGTAAGSQSQWLGKADPRIVGLETRGAIPRPTAHAACTRAGRCGPPPQPYS